MNTQEIVAQLNATLGTDAFTAAVDAVRSLDAKEARRLAREFTGWSVKSKAEALTRIADRHDALIYASARNLRIRQRSAA